ncbi:hypothetical protein [Candidatus Binatus sp.]
MKKRKFLSSKRSKFWSDFFISTIASLQLETKLAALTTIVAQNMINPE